MHISSTLQKRDRREFELIVDGQAVSTAAVVDRQLHIGGATVRMGGIGGVHTASEHRHKGYARQVLQHCIEFMEAGGYDVSLLFGISDFYPRWGYATTIADQRFVIAVENAAGGKEHLQSRKLAEGDMERVLEIYNGDNDTRTGCIQRPPFPADEFPRGSGFNRRPEVIVLTDGRQRMRGYVAIDASRRDGDSGQWEAIEGEVVVSEIGGSGPQVYDTILHLTAERAEKTGADEIKFCVPADHEFVRYALNFGGRLRIAIQADGGAMMRIINLQELMKKLEEELSGRITGACPDTVIGFATDIGDVSLTVAGGEVRVSEELEAADRVFELKQWKLMQLLMGYRPLEHVIADPREKAFAPESGLCEDVRPLKGDVRQVASALFLQECAYCWSADRF